MSSRHVSARRLAALGLGLALFPLAAAVAQGDIPVPAATKDPEAEALGAIRAAAARLSPEHVAAFDLLERDGLLIQLLIRFEEELARSEGIEPGYAGDYPPHGEDGGGEEFPPLTPEQETVKAALDAYLAPRGRHFMPECTQEQIDSQSCLPYHFNVLEGDADQPGWVRVEVELIDLHSDNTSYECVLVELASGRVRPDECG